VSVQCICCDKSLKNYMADEKGHQPYNGLAFQSRGAYGTTIFDPMDGSYIEITVCDECLRDAIESGIVFFSNPRERTEILAEFAPAQPVEEK
jgi:hypothetical protein